MENLTWKFHLNSNKSFCLYFSTRCRGTFSEGFLIVNMIQEVVVCCLREELSLSRATCHCHVVSDCTKKVLLLKRIICFGRRFLPLWRVYIAILARLQKTLQLKYFDDDDHDEHFTSGSYCIVLSHYYYQPINNKDRRRVFKVLKGMERNRNPIEFKNF